MLLQYQLQAFKGVAAVLQLPRHGDTASATGFNDSQAVSGVPSRPAGGMPTAYQAVRFTPSL